MHGLSPSPLLAMHALDILDELYDLLLALDTLSKLNAEEIGSTIEGFAPGRLHRSIILINTE